MANIYKSSEHYFSASGTVTLITAPAPSIVNSIVINGYTSGIVTVNLEKLGGISRVIFKVSSDGELTQGPLVLEEGDKLNVVGLTGVTVVASYVYSGTEITGMSISGLTDVDTTGVTDGQILVYNAGTGEWAPGTGGGGAVDSVNGQTGTVVLDGTDIAYDAGSTINQAIDGNTSNYNLLKQYIVDTDPDKVVVTKDNSNKIAIDATVGGESIVLTTNGKNAVTVSDGKVDILPVLNATGGLTVNNNVGIGTTTPAYPLDVDGNIRATAYRIDSATVLSGSGSVVLGSAGATTTVSIHAIGGEKMRIDSSGRVGIGTTSPTEKLHVNGDVKIEADLHVDGDTYGIYHRVSDGQYYFDDYQGTRNVNAFLKTTRSDIIKYQDIGTIEYWDGSSWVDATSSLLSNVEKLLDGRQDTYWNVPSAYYKFRFTVTASTSWPTVALIGAQTSWVGSTFPGYTMTVEEQQADSSWVTEVTADFTSANGVSNWGTAFLADNDLHTGRGSQPHSTRITIDFYGWTPSNPSYTTIQLQNIFIYSNFAGTEVNDYQNLLNYKRQIFAPNGVFVSGAESTDSGRIYFYDDDNSNYVSLESPATISSNVALKLPSAYGSSGQFIQTNATGELSFASVTQATGNELENIVEDTTPQLGGNLDVNGNSIVSASNGHIAIMPNGTGNVGIGTASPSAKLDVVGSSNISGNLDVTGDVAITGDFVNDLNFATGKSLLVGTDEYAFKYISGSYGLKFDTTNAQYAFTDGSGSSLVTFQANNGDTDINRDLQVGRNLNVIGHITVPEFVEGETNKNDRITFSEFGLTAGRIHDIGGTAVSPSSATATYKLGFCEDITANLILRGLVSVGTTISGTPALGQPLYLGASGTIVTTAPSTSGDIVRVIGHYMGEEQGGGSLVYFDPSNDWVEVS